MKSWNSTKKTETNVPSRDKDTGFIFKTLWIILTRFIKCYKNMQLQLIENATKKLYIFKLQFAPLMTGI